MKLDHKIRAAETQLFARYGLQPEESFVDVDAVNVRLRVLSVGVGAIGDPAVALPGATVRIPLSLLTVPVLSQAVLRTPSPRPVFRQLLGQGLSPAAW